MIFPITRILLVLVGDAAACGILILVVLRVL